MRYYRVFAFIVMLLIAASSAQFAASKPSHNYQHIVAQDGISTMGIDGIAVDSKGYIYLVSTRYPRIIKANNSGKIISSWPCGVGPTLEDGPNSIAIDSSDNVYVSFDSKNSIRKLSSKGKLVSEWKMPYSNADCIAADKRGNVYALGAGGFHRFDANGRLSIQWNDAGNDSGDFISSIAVDIAGNVYTVSPSSWETDLSGKPTGKSWTGCLRKFNLEGRMIGDWPLLRKNGEKFTHAVVAIDNSDHAYVLDRSHGVIARFSLDGKFDMQIDKTMTDADISMVDCITTNTKGVVYMGGFLGQIYTYKPDTGKIMQVKLH